MVWVNESEGQKNTLWDRKIADSYEAGILTTDEIIIIINEIEKKSFIPTKITLLIIKEFKESMR